MSKELFISHLEQSFINANNKLSKLNDEILSMEGMTGKLTRHFYNNILSIDDARYLEIGTWRGSSVCSSMFNNTANIVCIDNWSEFNGNQIKQEFKNNLDKYKGDNKISFIEQDCFKVDISTLPKFNIYLYDGAHKYDDHYKALTYYQDCLDDIFIYLVDDWNWSSVRSGTKDAIRDLQLNIIWEKEILLTKNNEHTPQPEATNTWWNGIGVFLLEKLK